uniref:Uncharacterized protein n=1 Tax=Romanomermis culicivorax TaxID=13658 RepID=A0A915ISC3_ROMCU
MDHLQLFAIDWVLDSIFSNHRDHNQNRNNHYDQHNNQRNPGRNDRPCRYRTPPINAAITTPSTKIVEKRQIGNIRLAIVT